jgi:hypothetical protein
MNSLRHALATGLLLGIAISVAACVSSRSTPTQRVSLFNGVDLSSWNVRCQPQDQGQTFWRVDQGTILCDSIGRRPTGYVWLVSDREFADFELTLQFQAYRHSPGNSGVQFRSRFDPTADGGWLDGPQVDIHPPTAMSWRTGLLYDETRGEQRWIFPGLKDWNMDPGFEPPSHVFRYGEDGGAWNTLTVVCQGTRVKTVVNGVVRTEWDGAGVLNNAFHRQRNVGMTGHFALQLHAGDELRIRFKDILVREL